MATDAEITEQAKKVRTLRAQLEQVTTTLGTARTRVKDLTVTQAQLVVALNTARRTLRGMVEDSNVP